MERCVIDSPVGPLCIEADAEGITALTRTDKPLKEPQTRLLKEAARQLRAYFDGALTHFDLPLHMAGTGFQLRCRQALLTIPCGETISYGEQARRIGSPGAARPWAAQTTATQSASSSPVIASSGQTGRSPATAKVLI